MTTVIFTSIITSILKFVHTYMCTYC